MDVSFTNSSIFGTGQDAPLFLTGKRQRSTYNVTTLPPSGGNGWMDGWMERQNHPQIRVKTQKRTWGALKECWVPHDIRDELVDFVLGWNGKTDFAISRFLRWCELGMSKFYDWRQR